MKILETLTVADFKSKTDSPSLKVMGNTKTGTKFISNGETTLAAVSKNYDSSDPDKEFILVQFDDSEDPLWILHNVSKVEQIEEL